MKPKNSCSDEDSDPGEDEDEEQHLEERIITRKVIGRNKNVNPREPVEEGTSDEDETGEVGQEGRDSEEGSEGDSEEDASAGGRKGVSCCSGR